MSGKYTITEHQNAIYEQYIAFRKRASSCAPSTERTIRSAIFSFFSYMNAHGIDALSDVKAEHLHDWHISSEHSSPRARNLYTSQLRIFFEYLSEKGLMPISLPWALSCQHAPNETVVKVLSREQIEAIEAYACNAKSPMQLRDSAMLMLGLKMGIRGADIYGLKLSDISWRKQIISFIQQKTGVYIELPMPVAVGNSIYRYITEGRPASTADTVFVNHVLPNNALCSAASVRSAIQRIFRGNVERDFTGFHITRRTFASQMLCSGNTVPMIAAALGHAGSESVNPYLSTDDENLRRCAIGCGGIEYSGRYGL